MRPVRVAAVLLALVLLATPALAHVPAFPTDNDAPGRAVEVPDPTKSWVFYDELSPGGVAYYRFTLAAGEGLQFGTFTPTAGAFTPSFVVMSPAFDRAEAVPSAVEVPAGMGAVVVEGQRPPEAGYEPFTPAATYQTASLSRPVVEETTVLVAVYEPADRGGPVGVVIGAEESFSTREYLTVPFDLVRVHLWAGTSPLVVLGPGLLVLLGGLAMLRRRPEEPAHAWLRYGLGAAGLLIAASGVNTLVQMGIALAEMGPAAGALVTAAFVVVPLVSGGWAVRLAVAERFDPGLRCASASSWRARPRRSPGLATSWGPRHSWWSPSSPDGCSSSPDRACWLVVRAPARAAQTARDGAARGTRTC